MPYCASWEEFAKGAERLYIMDPMKVRYTMKYNHNKGKLVIKITDDVSCVMYMAEHTQDIKKVEKLTSQLMRHMASKEK